MVTDGGGEWYSATLDALPRVCSTVIVLWDKQPRWVDVCALLSVVYFCKLNDYWLSISRIKRTESLLNLTARPLFLTNPWLFVVMRLVLSLQELCCRTIAARTTIYSVDQLPLPTALKAHLKSYLLTASCTRSTSLVRSSFLHRGTTSLSVIGSCRGDRAKKHRIIRPSDSPPYNSRSSCIVS